MIPVLTIAIPTFNRCSQLDQLLSSIHKQLDGVRQAVRVIVVDNDSTDGTKSICDSWMSRIGGMAYFKNHANLGMAENIVRCHELAETQYCWVFGDDDMIRVGALERIVTHLVEEQPDLFYCGYTAFKDRPDEQLASFSEPLSCWIMDASDFCRIVQINMTFLSAVITSKAAFFQRGGASQTRLYADTLLPQLAWVFECLVHGRKFSYARQPLVLARLEGSGGFNIIKLFTTDLVRIIDRALPPDLGKALKRRTLIKFIPSLICTVRQGKRGNFEVPQGLEGSVREAFSAYMCCWLIALPLLRLPIPLTPPFFYASRMFSNCLSVYDRALYLSRRKRSGSR